MVIALRLGTSLRKGVRHTVVRLYEKAYGRASLRKDKES